MNGFVALLAQYGVPLVFVSTLAKRIGLPVPAAPVIVVAAALGAAGGIAFWPMVAASIIANLLGDAAWFAAGRRFGHRVMRLLCRVSLSPDSCVRQSENFITRWGGSALIAAKFLPGVSTIAAPMSGALGMSVTRFLAFDLAGAAVWTLAYALLGVIFRKDIEAVLDTLASVGLLTGGALLAALAVYLFIRYLRRRSFLLALATPRLSVAELRELIEQDPKPTVIDVRARSSVELDPRRIPGALAIELGEIEARARELPADSLIVLYCNCPNEVSAAQGARLLAKAGIVNSRVLHGGLDGWVAEGGRVDDPSSRAASAAAAAPAQAAR